MPAALQDMDVDATGASLVYAMHGGAWVSGHALLCMAAFRMLAAEAQRSRLTDERPSHRPKPEPALLALDRLVKW